MCENLIIYLLFQNGGRFVRFFVVTVIYLERLLLNLDSLNISMKPKLFQRLK